VIALSLRIRPALPAPDQRLPAALDPRPVPPRPSAPTPQRDHHVDLTPPPGEHPGCRQAGDSGVRRGAARTQADRGIFITTSRFTPEAITYADRVAARVVLIDGATLSGLMVPHNIGVQNQQTYAIKRVDEDFFEES
jgi:hypothetical protein